MMGDISVKIDLDRLARRLGDGQPASYSAVHFWLFGCGLSRRAGLWHGPGESLRHLRPDEVAEVVTIREIDAVKFVEITHLGEAPA